MLFENCLSNKHQRKMRKILALLLVLVLYSVSAFSQNKPVSGKVVDDQGQPISFASVKVKRTDRGVVADDQGNFIIQAHEGDILIVSGVGIKPYQYTVTSATSALRIAVTRSSGALTEVVVTALGQATSKAKVGYATQTFNTAIINKNGATGALDGLEGKIAGADISNTGGPGSSTKVVLRGYGAIAGANNQPLYVIDGVPMSDGSFNQMAGGTDGADYGNGMTNINPNDIESITVLKGTAASSLYGGLAKNGAIIITTKRGKSGKLHIDIASSANFSRVGKLPDYQNQFGQGWGGLLVTDENGSWGAPLDGVERPWGAEVDGVQRTKPYSYIKNNLRDFYGTGQEYNNNLALSGGNEQSKFYFSWGNVTSNSVIPSRGNNQQRNTFALRTTSVYGRFSISSSFNFVTQALKVPNTGQSTSSGGGVFESLLQIPVDIPISSFKDYNNPYNNISNYFTPFAENPYFGLGENGNKQNLTRFFGNVDLGYKFTNDLSAELRVGGDFTDANTFVWKQVATPASGEWDGPDPINPEGASRTPDIGEVGQGSNTDDIINTDLILKYNKNLNQDFNLNALVGGNFYQEYGRAEYAQITNLILPSFYNLSNSTSPPTVSDAVSTRRRMGAYGQVTLGYKDQLYLTGNVRDDWSSTLPYNANSIFYPGANLSWVASQLIGRNSALSYLKFRAAYGRTGSDPLPYQVLQTLQNGTVSLPFGQMTSPFNGIAGYGVSSQINNADLKPIFTDEFEVGAEARFFNDRIGLDVSLYDKKTKGQIFSVPIAPSTGYTSLVENLGTIGNKGIEVALNAKPVETRSFTWSFIYTFSKNWNKVLDLTGASSQNPLITSAYAVEMRAPVGGTVASIYGPVPPMENGHVVVDATTGYPSQNLAPLDKFGNPKAFYGNGLYDYMMGWSNTFTYKQWTLTASLDFRYGGVMYSETADMALFTGNGILTTYNDRKPFIIPGSVNATTDNTGKTVYTPNRTFIGANGGIEGDDTYGYYYPAQNLGSASRMRVIDRSFLKLRDINLSYSLPMAWAAKVKASNASLGIYGRNFLLWTPKDNVYVDPEATNLGNDLGSQLGEFATAPLTKEFGIILKVGF
jgi:TonB-linked SusC/RagA family outer membrane protein